MMEASRFFIGHVQGWIILDCSLCPSIILDLKILGRITLMQSMDNVIALGFECDCKFINPKPAARRYSPFLVFSHGQLEIVGISSLSLVPQIF